MLHRLAALAFAALCLSVLPAAAQDDATVSRWLGAAFARLPAPDRITVQDELSLAGLFTTAIDGHEGADTDTALLYSVDFIADNSLGHVVIPMAGPEDAEAYVQALGRREHSDWLYGEGEEGE